MVSYTLTEGSLATIIQGDNQVKLPIMQILSSKRTVKECNILSDGKYYISNAVFTAKSKNLASREVTKFSILKIKKYTLRSTGKAEKQVLEIVDYEILTKGDKINKRVGFPRWISGSSPKPNVNIKGKLTQEEDVTAPDPRVKVTHTISSLTPELDNWVIKARIVEKSDIMPWSRSKRNTINNFFMRLIDETGEIRAVAFKHLADKFHSHIEVDDEYYISKCELSTATKSLSKIGHDYELVITDETLIKLNDYSIEYDFIRMDEISSWELGDTVDVIGVCKDISDLRSVKSIGEKTRLLRNITLSSRNAELTVTLWDLDAKYFRHTWDRNVIAVKSAKVKEDNGTRTLSVEQGSFIKTNMIIKPDENIFLSW